MEAAIGLTGRLVTWVLGQLAKERSKTEQARRRRRSRAIATTLTKLHTLHNMMLRYESGPNYPRRVSGRLRALHAWEHQNAALMPFGWGGVMNQVVISVGEALGGVAASPYDDRMINEPVMPYSMRWQENSSDYVAYITGRLTTWSLNPSNRQAKRFMPLGFDAWLKVREKNPFTRWGED
jgi:hypothetical protein